MQGMTGSSKETRTVKDDLFELVDAAKPALVASFRIGVRNASILADQLVFERSVSGNSYNELLN